jgi:hypothetical protein
MKLGSHLSFLSWFMVGSDSTHNFYLCLWRGLILQYVVNILHIIALFVIFLPQNQH